MSSKTINIENRKIEITHSGKELFPGISKLDVVEYYEKIGEVMLPHCEKRPMMMHRYPDGIDGKDFYHKQVPDYFPGWIDTISVKVKKKGQADQVFVECNDIATLVYLAGQATITPHIWLSRKNNIQKPDKMIFDLDPPQGDFEAAKQGAGDLHKLLDEIGLPSYLMTTGSKGLHVVISIDTSEEFDDVRNLAKGIAEFLANENPDDYTVETLKEKRKGRLFLDYLRNSYGQTSVAPYSLRAYEKAPVATPIDWNELNDVDDAKKYNMDNIFRRMSRKDDPWKDIYKHPKSLKHAAEKLGKL